MNNQKIEPWMVAAAREVIEAEDEGYLFRTIRNEMEATEGRRAGTDRDATQRTYEALAAIIARHAPDPASVPIGPGDVVQVVERIPYQLVGGYPDFDVSELLYVREVEGENIIVYRMHMSVSIPRAYVTRIGRAVYWPDGTKVEEGK